MEVAATQEWIREVFLGVRRDHNDGSVFCSDRLVNLNDVKFHLVEYVEHVILKVGVGFIDFVDEEDDPFTRYKPGRSCPS